MSTALVGFAIVLAIIGAGVLAVILGAAAVLWEVALFYRLGQ